MSEFDEGLLGWRKETGKRARQRDSWEDSGWDPGPGAFTIPRHERGPVSDRPLFDGQTAK